ncbi:MAG: DUF6048 family protein [Cytophagales bacterium]|nr:DUF6048 family protein [Cytophagales bacterium]
MIEACWRYFSRQIPILFGISFLGCGVHLLCAQVSDSLNTRSPWISQLGIQLDYGKILGLPIWRDSKPWASNLFGVFQHKYALDLLLGHEIFHSTQPVYENLEYYAKGTYGVGHISRVWMFSKKYSFWLGAGYGFSKYRERGDIHIWSPSGLYPNYQRSFDRNGLSAKWWEIKVASYQRMWKGLHVGFGIRGRFLINRSETPLPQTYRIPGLGIVRGQPYPAFNLWIAYDILSLYPKEKS